MKNLALIRLNKRTSAILHLESTVVKAIGLEIRTTGRLLEQDGYTEVVGHKYLERLRVVLTSPLEGALLEELSLVAAAAPALPPPPPPPPPVLPPTAPATAPRAQRAAAQANPHAPAAAPPAAPLPPAAPPALTPALAPALTYAELCADGDLKDVEVLKAMAQMIVAPARAYLMRTVFGECLPQVERMLAARKFDPLNVISNDLVDADVDTLVSKYNLFKLPCFKDADVDMKKEIAEYKAAVAEIKPLAERRDEDGKDTFDIEAWWCGNEARLPAWSKVLRAVLCHVPNSAPPERAFSILNDSFEADQTRALADYKSASIMLQYNNRGRDGD